jgi:hypothetical protein
VQVDRYLSGREDVGMSGDKLVRDTPGDLLNRETLYLLAGDLGMEDDLEQQITELLAEMILIPGLNGLDRLGSLLDEVLRQRTMGLLGIPRALMAQPRHH